MSKRDEIANAVVEGMKNINAENGYYTDIGSNVFEWIERPLGDEETPCLIIRDPKTTNEASSNQNMHTLEFEIDIFIKGSKDVNTLNLRMLMSDVIRAFGRVCDEDIHEIGEYKGSETLSDFRGYAYASARLEFSVTYYTGKWEH